MTVRLASAFALSTLTALVHCTDLTSAELAWLKTNAVEVKTVEAGNGFADLQKLKAMLGGGARAGGQPADFTDDVWEFGASDGEIFAAIAGGTSADMESYGDRIKPTEIWNLVNYLRTLKP